MSGAGWQGKWPAKRIVVLVLMIIIAVGGVGSWVYGTGYPGVTFTFAIGLALGGLYLVRGRLPGWVHRCFEWTEWVGGGPIDVEGSDRFAAVKDLLGRDGKKKRMKKNTD